MRLGTLRCSATSTQLLQNSRYSDRGWSLAVSGCSESDEPRGLVRPVAPSTLEIGIVPSGSGQKGNGQRCWTLQVPAPARSHRDLRQKPGTRSELFASGSLLNHAVCSVSATGQIDAHGSMLIATSRLRLCGLFRVVPKDAAEGSRITKQTAPLLSIQCGGCHGAWML